MKIKRINGVMIFAVFAYLVNFLWESLHSAYLYEGHNEFTNQFYVRMVSYVSFVDMIILLVIFLIGILIWRDVWWSRKKSVWQYLFVVFVPFLTAVFIEARAIFFTNRWVYDELMPTIFGLGISPLLQLPLTMCLSIYFQSLTDTNK